MESGLVRSYILYQKKSNKERKNLQYSDKFKKNIFCPFGRIFYMFRNCE